MQMASDSTRHRLVALLQRAQEGASTEALAGELGVTVTAVRQHLMSLERDGLVTRGDTVPSGGRPQQLFVLTEAGKETFPRQYSWFSEVLLDAMRAEMGTEKLKKTLRVLGDDAGKASPAPSGQLPERARALAAKMQELGYDARVKDGPGVEIEAGNCVFHQLAAKHPEVCSFDLGLIERVAGASVEHDECIVRGGGVCRFRLKARGK